MPTRLYTDQVQTSTLLVPKSGWLALYSRFDLACRGQRRYIPSGPNGYFKAFSWRQRSTSGQGET